MPIDDLLRYLVEEGGSDLHVMAGLPPAIRLAGELTAVEGSERLTPDQTRYMIFEILNDEQREKFEHDPATRNELDFAYSLAGVGRFRFNVHRQRGTVGFVARALATEIPKFSDLGLPASIVKFTQAKKGLALVTGPTGSGKSTTLAAIVDTINATRADHIITIEDPIEYIHNSKRSYVMQREVSDSGDTLSFRNALKASLRQDPDVIMIGEMRDYETIGIAITSAETGHLVFGTLHTSSAAQTISRIIDVFPSDQVEQVKTQLAGNLFGVCSQVLFPKVGGGRCCACEILFTTSAVRNNIRMYNLDQINQSIQTGLSEGMCSMDAACSEMVKGGKIEYETALPYLRDESTKRNLASFAKAPASEGAQPATQTTAQAAGPPPQEPASRGGMAIPPWEKQ